MRLEGPTAHPIRQPVAAKDLPDRWGKRSEVKEEEGTAKGDEPADPTVTVRFQKLSSEAMRT
jgi:hypothetical protein